MRRLTVDPKNVQREQNVLTFTYIKGILLQVLLQYSQELIKLAPISRVWLALKILNLKIALKDLKLTKTANQVEECSFIGKKTHLEIKMQINVYVVKIRMCLQKYIRVSTYTSNQQRMKK